MEELLFNLELKLDEADKKLDNLLSKAEKKAGESGKQAGKSFGNAFASIAGGILAGISFSSIFNQANKAIQSYRNLQGANLVLESAVESVNKTNLRQNQILQSTTASLEEKGRALGYSTSQLYEEVKATQSSGKANYELEKTINKAENALEDQTRAIENQIRATEANIKALQEKSRAEVQAIRNAKNYGGLTDEQYALEKELTDLEIQKLEIAKTGDTFATIYAENAIKAKRLDLNLVDQKIKKIDLETKKVEDGYKSQIDALKSQVTVFRDQISAQKNQFDIDIAPAKRKLEELKSAASGGGGGSTKIKQFKPEIIQEIEDSMKNPFEQIKMGDVSKAVDDFYKKFNGVVGRSTIVQGFSDLLRSGVYEINDITSVLSGFLDIASAGKTPFITMDTALMQLTQQFRTMNAQLGESAGLTEEYLTPNSGIIARGLESLQAQGILVGKNAKELTNEQKAMAAREGLIPIMSASQNIFNKKLNDGTLASEEFGAKTRELYEAFGKALAPAQTAFYEALTPLVVMLTNFVSDNPQIAKSFVIISAALVGIISTALILIPAIGTLSTAFAGLGAWLAVNVPLITAITASFGAGGFGAALLTALAALNPVIVGLGALLGFLVLLYTQSEKFREGFSAAAKFVGEAVAGLKDNFALNIGKIIGFFVSLPAKLVFWIGVALFDIFNTIRNFDWASAWQGFTDYFTKGQWKTDLKKGLEAISQFLEGFFDGIFAGTPLEGKIKLINKNQKNSWKGGGFTGLGNSNEIAGVVHRNESVLNPEQMSGLIHAIAKIGGSTSISYQQNNYGGQSNTWFPLPYAIN
jgi:hemoglobin-like flavoprotein